MAAGAAGPQVGSRLAARRALSPSAAAQRDCSRSRPAPHPRESSRSARSMARPQALSFGLLLAVVTVTLAAAQKGEAWSWGRGVGSCRASDGEQTAGLRALAPRPDGAGGLRARTRRRCAVPGGGVGLGWVSGHRPGSGDSNLVPSPKAPASIAATCPSAPPPSVPAPVPGCGPQEGTGSSLEAAMHLRVVGGPAGTYGSEVCFPFSKNLTNAVFIVGRTDTEINCKDLSKNRIIIPLLRIPGLKIVHICVSEYR